MEDNPFPELNFTKIAAGSCSERRDAAEPEPRWFGLCRYLAGAYTDNRIEVRC